MLPASKRLSMKWKSERISYQTSMHSSCIYLVLGSRMYCCTCRFWGAINHVKLRLMCSTGLHVNSDVGKTCHFLYQVYRYAINTVIMRFVDFLCVLDVDECFGLDWLLFSWSGCYGVRKEMSMQQHYCADNVHQWLKGFNVEYSGWVENDWLLVDVDHMFWLLICLKIFDLLASWEYRKVPPMLIWDMYSWLLDIASWDGWWKCNDNGKYVQLLSSVRMFFVFHGWKLYEYLSSY